MRKINKKNNKKELLKIFNFYNFVNLHIAWACFRKVKLIGQLQYFVSTNDADHVLYSKILQFQTIC